MLKLVTDMKGSDDAIVQEVFDQAVKADRDRLLKQIQHWTYGISLEQLCADGVRVTTPERIQTFLPELVEQRLITQYLYSNGPALYFHSTNRDREMTTRRALKLEILEINERG